MPKLKSPSHRIGSIPRKAFLPVFCLSLPKYLTCLWPPSSVLISSSQASIQHLVSVSPVSTTRLSYQLGRNSAISILTMTSSVFAPCYLSGAPDEEAAEGISCRLPSLVTSNLPSPPHTCDPSACGRSLLTILATPVLIDLQPCHLRPLFFIVAPLNSLANQTILQLLEVSHPGGLVLGQCVVSRGCSPNPK